MIKMGRRSSLLRRPEATRVILAVVAVGLAGLSLTATLANVLVNANPVVAHSLAPWDGQSTAKLAKLEFALAPNSAVDSKQAKLARRALRQDPTAVEALDLLALQAQLRQDTGTTRVLFAQSLKLSRRELRPRLWAIEEAVARGDLETAMNNYDIALRTSDSAPAILFPILTSALRERRIRDELIRVLRKRPEWAGAFIDYATKSQAEPGGVASLFNEAKSIELPVSAEDQAALVNGLIAKNLYTQAWSYYATFRPNVRRDTSRDEDFELDPKAGSVLDWSVSDYASIQSGKDRGVVEFSFPPTVGGLALQQMELLPPGNYFLEGESAGVDQPTQSRPYWEVRCRDGRVLGRVVIASPGAGRAKFEGAFAVPEGCPAQSVTLFIRPTDAIEGVSGRVERVRLAPAR